MKQPKPKAMKKTMPKTAPAGRKGGPDMTMGKKAIGPKRGC